MKLLFVCNAGLNRSPTFERYFEKNLPEYEVRSCGIYFGYPYQLNKELLEWADKVYVMTVKMARFIKEKYPEHSEKTYVVGIEDEFDPDDPNLVIEIKWWVEHLFPVTL